MRYKLFLAALISFSFTQANANECKQIRAYSLVCSDPGYFMRANPIFKSSLSTPGSNARLVNILLENQCWITPKKLDVKITNKRDFRTKDFVAKLIYIETPKSVGFNVDKYSAEGEYLGKKTIYRNKGWTGKYTLDCDQTSNKNKPIPTTVITKEFDDSNTKQDALWNCEKVETDLEKLLCKKKG